MSIIFLLSRTILFNFEDIVSLNQNKDLQLDNNVNIQDNRVYNTHPVYSIGSFYHVLNSLFYEQ